MIYILPLVQTVSRHKRKVFLLNHRRNIFISVNLISQNLFLCSSTDPLSRIHISFIHLQVSVEKKVKFVI